MGMTSNRSNKPSENTLDFEGRQNSVTTAERDIWELITEHIEISAIATVSTVSTSALDASGNTGIQAIRISGLNATFDPIQEIIVLDGITPVVSLTSFFRINFIEASLVGSNGSAVGTITLSESGNPQAIIAIGANNSQKTHGTTPRDVIVSRIFWQTFRGQSCIFKFKFKLAGQDFFRTLREVEANDAHVVAEIGRKFPIGTDFKITVQAVAGTATATAGYDLA